MENSPAAKTMKPVLRWSLIVLSGGVGLWMSYVMGHELWSTWFRPNSSSMNLIVVAFFGLLFVGPCLAVASYLLRREDPAAIELISFVVAVMSFFVWSDLENQLGIKKWFAVETGQDWGAIKIAVAFILLILPFVVSRLVYRLCRKLGSRFLLNQPGLASTRRIA